MASVSAPPLTPLNHLKTTPLRSSSGPLALQLALKPPHLTTVYPDPAHRLHGSHVPNIARLMYAPGMAMGVGVKGARSGPKHQCE